MSRRITAGTQRQANVGEGLSSSAFIMNSEQLERDRKVLLWLAALASRTWKETATTEKTASVCAGRMCRSSPPETPLKDSIKILVFYSIHDCLPHSFQLCNSTSNRPSKICHVSSKARTANSGPSKSLERGPPTQNRRFLHPT